MDARSLATYCSGEVDVGCLQLPMARQHISIPDSGQSCNSVGIWCLEKKKKDNFDVATGMNYGVASFLS